MATTDKHSAYIQLRFRLMVQRLGSRILSVQKRVGHEYRSNKTPVLPAIKLLDGPGHCPASAQHRYIERLSNEVWELQQQLHATQRENRLLQRLQSRHTTALQHFQDVQADLPQLLCNHSNEVKALQELSRRDKTQINNLSRKLQSTESTLLHTRDTLHRLQRLAQDQHLEERETLTHRLSVLTVDLDKKNKRIQDLETNLALRTESFKRQISAEMRKATEARDLSRHLEEMISNLMQKIKVMEKELANYDIYSHRFLKGTKHKCVQTEPPVIVVEPPPLPMQIEHPQEDMEKNTWEVDANEAAKESSEDELTHEENFNETTPETTENKLFLTEPLMSIALEPPPLPLQIEYPQADMEENTLFYLKELDANEPGPDSEDELTQKENEETSNETPPDITKTSGTDGIELEYNAEQEEITAGLTQDSASDEPSSEDINDQLDSQNLVSTNKDTQSPVTIRQQYTFRETVQNLHSGKPAYGTSQRSGPRFHRRKATSNVLDTGTYEPTVFAPSNTRKNKLKN
ncbi:lebercilin-like protein [Hemibagrus wyckioides]|uniref:lebercilin-like protein n=1 Tax=Hemibagrus wyckioides TaxID=337641 RepID=UPI00266BE11A|nr:lebercilin-like protein [Hemibagrus wyckioides]